jgi:hypothetical protein
MDQSASASVATAQYGRPRLTIKQHKLSMSSFNIIWKIQLAAIATSTYFALQQPRLALISITVNLVLVYEQFLRSKILRNRRNTMVGKLKSRLSFLPYSEPEFNNQFLSIFPSSKLRQTSYSHKLNASSTLINYAEGLRKTSFVPPDQVSKSEIYLFGNSTLECQEVPDDYTISSQLQKRLNGIASPSSGYEVKNLGIHGFSVKENYQHFLTVPLKADDLVIFFFGAIDTFFPPELFKFKFSPQLTLDKFYRLSKSLQIRSLARMLDRFRTFKVNHELFVQRPTEYRKIFESINSLCEKNNAKFIAVLQPFLHTRYPSVRLDHKKFFFHPLNARFRAALFLYDKFIATFKDQSFFIDGRGIFNQTQLDVYIDWVHTNYLGNKIIADFFYSIIEQHHTRS